MPVYVDSARNRIGPYLMCHMVADTTAELLAMVDRIGVQRKWIQRAGKPDEHFDICQSKRRLAVAAGAEQVSGKQLVMVIHRKRLEVARHVDP